MRSEHYADRYRNFANYMRGPWPAAPIAPQGTKLIACGSMPGIAGGKWDEALLESLAQDAHEGGSALQLVDYVALHNYTWVGSTLECSDDDYRKALENIEAMRMQIEAAVALCDDKSTEQHQIGVIIDEWGIWYLDKDPDNLQLQQATMLDAVFAAAALHMFHSVSGLFMSNLSTMINALQSLILTDEPRMLRTPTYHVWEMFMPHRDATLVEYEADGVSTSATISDDGVGALSIVNTSLDEPVELTISGVEVTGGQVLTAANVRDHNTFDEPDRIVPQPFDRRRLPPHSVGVVSFK